MKQSKNKAVPEWKQERINDLISKIRCFALCATFVTFGGVSVACGANNTLSEEAKVATESEQDITYREGYLEIGDLLVSTGDGSLWSIKDPAEIRVVVKFDTKGTEDVKDDEIIDYWLE